MGMNQSPQPILKLLNKRPPAKRDEQSGQVPKELTLQEAQHQEQLLGKNRRWTTHISH